MSTSEDSPHPIKKIIISTLASTVLVWFFFGYLKAQQNSEFNGIAKALVATSQLGECVMETRLQRNWPASWTRKRVELTASKGDNSLSTTISSYIEPPDREHQGGGVFRYGFPWEQRDENGRTDATLLSLDIQWPNPQFANGEIRSFRIEHCDDYPGVAKAAPIMANCRSAVEIITCS